MGVLSHTTTTLTDLEILLSHTEQKSWMDCSTSFFHKCTQQGHTHGQVIKTCGLRFSAWLWPLGRRGQLKDSHPHENPGLRSQLAAAQPCAGTHAKGLFTRVSGKWEAKPLAASAPLSGFCCFTARKELTQARDACKT